jgi:hypothetical protein
MTTEKRVERGNLISRINMGQWLAPATRKTIISRENAIYGMRVIVNAKKRVISSIYVIFDIRKKSCQIVAMRFFTQGMKERMTFGQNIENPRAPCGIRFDSPN